MGLSNKRGKTLILKLIKNQYRCRKIPKVLSWGKGSYGEGTFMEKRCILMVQVHS
jgi:hypothetical protein